MVRPILLSVCLLIVAGRIASSAEGEKYEPPQIFVPEGFTAELAAAPPLVKHPLMAGFDERGRLFIAESAGENLKREALEKELPNFVRMLEDTDGDGVFDKSTIFADKMTMPQGALWYRGALYVRSSGGLWRLEDTDDDGVADKREMIVGGFNYTGNAADIHGPFLSPTGRLYWCDGRHGHEFKDDDGKVISKGKAARIFSCRPDGSDVQTHCGGGMDNPVEVDFMPTGEMLGTVNLFYRQRGDCLVHWVRGGVYPRYDQPDCLAEFPSTGEPLTEVYNYGHVAVSGCTRYRSGEHGFGKQYADNFFVTQFNTHKVVRTVLARDGGTFTAETHDFLHSESGDFHPTDVLEDADGSLLVIDTGGWFRIGCPTSQIAKPNIHGAIWRIRKKDGHTLKDPRGLKIEWQKQSPMDLLADKRFAVRERAVDESARRYHRSTDKFARRMLAEEQPEIARQNTIWALARMTQNLPDDHIAQDREELELSLRVHSMDAAHWIARTAGGEQANTSEEVRIAAWHAAAHGAATAPEIYSAESLAEVSAAAAALGTQGTGIHGIARALDYLKLPLDRTTEHAMIHAVISIGQAKEAHALLNSDGRRFPYVHSPRMKRAILIALDQMPNGELQRETVLRLVEGDDFALQQTALKIVASHPEWAKGIDEVIGRQLQRSALSDASFASLGGLLTAFINESAVQNKVGDALAAAELDESVAMALLGAMGGMRNAPWPMTWHKSVTPLLASENRALQLAAVSAIVDAEEASFADHLVRLVDDEKAPLNLRVSAIVGLAKFGRPPGDAGLSLLLDQLDADEAPARLQAAGALGSARLNDDQLRSLLREFSKMSALELGPLLAAFEQSKSAEVGIAMVDALKSSPAKAAIPPRRLQELLAGYPNEVKRRAEDLLVSSSPDAAQQRKRLDELLAGIEGGDAKRGREVFFGRRAVCASCHRVGGEGGDVGPNLSTIGARRDRRDLVEAIAFPSASLARGFESYTISTSQGKLHTGVILRQTADALHLRTTDQNEARIPRAAVDAMIPSLISVMPQGIDRTLAAQELADLVAYLQSLR